MSGELRIIPIRGIGEVRPGDDLTATILAALDRQATPLADGDARTVVAPAEVEL